MKIIRTITRSILITLVVLYWTIARHEGSHALMARMSGAEVEQLRLIPGIDEDVGFYFAFVRHTGENSWLHEVDNLFMDAVTTLLITYLITGIHELVYFYRQWKFHFSKSVRLEKGNIQAKYETLKTQINRQYLVRFTAIHKIHILSKSRIKLEMKPVPKEDLLVAVARTHEFRLWLDR